MKVPSGKLLKATVAHEGDLILSVKYSGDFFMHPEDALERLEAKLRGIKVTDVRVTVEQELDGVTLYGVDSESLVKIVWEAIG